MMVAPTVKHGCAFEVIRMKEIYEPMLPRPAGKKQAPINAPLVM